MSIYDLSVKARDGGIAGRFEPTASLDKLKAKVEELL